MNSRNHTKRQNSITSGEKSLKMNMLMIKNIVKFEVIEIILVNTEVLHVTYVVLRYNVHEEIPVNFHNGSNYDHHFIIRKIRELGEEFEEQFTCLGENIKKYIRFSVPIKNR